MSNIRHVKLYTMLGSMTEITDIHIKSLANIKTENFEVVGLGARDRRLNKKYKNLFDEIGIESKIIDRESINAKPPFDGMYDVMMKKFKPRDIFITAHDDCIFGKKCNILKLVREKLNTHDFCLKLENNSDMKKVCSLLNIKNTTSYSKLFVNGKSMHDIRFGTWFLAGNYSSYVKNKLSFGDERKLIPLIYNVLKRDFNVKIKSPYLYVDGGFNFNLEVHRLGLKYFLIDDKLDLRHLVHATNFFTRRGFSEIGSPNEWKKRWDEFAKENKNENVLKEKNYFLYLNSAIKNLGYEIKKIELIIEKCI